jgi:hypothetical protein
MNKLHMVLLSVLFSAPIFSMDLATEANTADKGQEAAINQASTTTDDKKEAPKASATADDKKEEAPKAPAPDTTQDKNTTQDKKEEAPKAPETPAVEQGRLATLAQYAAMPFVCALVTAPDKVANFTKLNAALTYVASANFLGGAEGRLATKAAPVMGRVIVLATVAAAAYQAYVMYTAEEAVDADEDFFSENN